MSQPILPEPLPNPPPETPKLLHQVVDQLAAEAPSETWIEIVQLPPERSFEFGQDEEATTIGPGDAACRIVTFAMLAKYVDGMARWIQDRCKDLVPGD